MNLTELLVVALASWQAVEVFHHGDIFTETRARLETELTSNGIRRFVSELMLCPFCLCVWVSVSATCWIWLAGDSVFSVPLYGLAVARLANLGNDAVYYVSRTPGRAGPEDDDPIEK